jgi:hypothetical protein
MRTEPSPSTRTSRPILEGNNMCDPRLLDLAKRNVWWLDFAGCPQSCSRCLCREGLGALGHPALSGCRRRVQSQKALGHSKTVCHSLLCIPKNASIAIPPLEGDTVLGSCFDAEPPQLPSHTIVTMALIQRRQEACLHVKIHRQQAVGC